MKKQDQPFPVSSIEFDKIYRVMDKRISLGYSARELSFFLGYRLTYVRDVENPLHTLRYTTKDTNYLLSIFDCELSEIMADKIPEAFYHIRVETNSINGRSVYKIHRDITPKYRAPIREIAEDSNENPHTTSDGIIISEIEEFIENLFNNQFFDKPKTALEVLKIYVRRFGNSIAPYVVVDAIGKYTSKRKAPRLIQDKNESGRTVYIKEF